ncbi:MAG: OB-fold domain-containing protein [Actinomycetota bacterium]|nr:OB-fold domain-containing protein [Actinomycetota bacterium]MED5293470.1 OB-fold domain-containing protein [Actinomycetota bacterium]
MSAIEHPLPFASWESRGFWEGAGRAELVLQRCQACDLVQHRPRGVCAHCLDDSALTHFTASGSGKIYSFTVTEQNQAKGFAEACPYVMAYVELDEGPRMLTVIVDCEPGDVAIGSRVVADFVLQTRDDAEVFAVPVFRLS